MNLAESWVLELKSRLSFLYLIRIFLIACLNCSLDRQSFISRYFYWFSSMGGRFFEELIPLFYFFPLGDMDKWIGSANRVFNDFLVLDFFMPNLSPYFSSFCYLLTNLILLSFLSYALASSGRLIELCRFLTPRFSLFFNALCISYCERFRLLCLTGLCGILPSPPYKLRLLMLAPSLWFNRPSRSFGVETSKELWPSSWSLNSLS